MSKYQSVIVILNGKQSNNPELRNAITHLRNEGHQIQVRIPWEFDDTYHYIAHGLDQGIDTVIAAGGDGTINAVASTLMKFPVGARPTLGILPMGTANDFASSANIPLEIDAALSLAVKGHAVAIDIAMVNEQHYFLNMATGGFGTRVTTETPEALKSALGGAAYVINGMLRPDTLKTDLCRLEGENFSWEGETLVIAVGNGRQAGGGQQLTPDALINDGALNLLVAPTREAIPAFLSSLFSADKNEHLVEKQLSWVKITSRHEMILNLDGEPLSGNSFTFKTQAGAIQCRLPPQCHLLA